MTRYIRVGKVSRRVRPPTTVRPPTQTTQAQVSDWVCSTGTYSGDPLQADFNLPSVVAGDLLMLFIATGVGGVDASYFSNPGGWTEISSSPETQNHEVQTFYRVADGTEGSTVHVEDPGGGGYAYVVNRVRPGSTPWASASYDGGSANYSGTNPINPPSVTPTGTPGTYLVYVPYATSANGSSPAKPTITTPPSGYTIGAECTPGGFGNAAIGVCYAIVDITTSEDPGAYGVLDQQSGITTGNVQTIIVSGFDGSGGDPEVAPGDHTHDASDLTDFAAAAAKGDLLVSDGDSWEVLTVGSNDQVLTADSAQSLGVKWSTAAASAIDDLSDVDTTTTAPTSGDLLEFDGTNWVPITPEFTKELLMQDGVTNPPVPIENEAQDDWLYQD